MIQVYVGTIGTRNAIFNWALLSGFRAEACSLVTVIPVDRHQHSQHIVSPSIHTRHHVTFLELELSFRRHNISSIPCCCHSTSFCPPSFRFECRITRGTCQPRVLLHWWPICRRRVWFRSTYHQGPNVRREIEPCCQVSEAISTGVYSWSRADRNCKVLATDVEEFRADLLQNWLNKPDGSPGWASYFTSRGYTVYILDQTARGRSPWKPGNGTLSTYSAEVIQQRFTAPQKYNLWPQAALHTQWPGDGVMGDTYFDNYYASNVPSIASATEQQSAVKAAGVSLLDSIEKPVILVSHSQGGLMPWLIADARPELTKAIVSLEPSGPPFRDAVFGNGSARAFGLTDIPITYDPPVESPNVDLVQQTIAAPNSTALPCTIQADEPPPRQLVNLKNIPVLLLTSEASYHAQYDWCTARFLQQAGVNVTHLELAGVGIRGNGHLVFLERNSDEVADVVEQWVGRIDQAC
jgi:pimeloyl-ACP methyl ester carboxylesterase